VRNTAAFALFLVVAFAARGEEPAAGLVVRPLLGITLSGSDSGFGVGAQLGVRLSSVLLRVSLDLGTTTGRRGYFAGTLRGDWLHPMSEATTLVAGVGFGALNYGFIFDDPAADLPVLTPAVGVLFGRDRWFGRVVAAVTGFVPLGSVSHERDFAGQAISPPHVMATLLLSL
jgi:hypothetical protein